MFHVKQLFTKIQSIPITDLLLYLFFILAPFQLRTILNFDDAFIDYYFSYHKAFFIYASDLAVVTLALTCFFTQKRLQIKPLILLLLAISLIGLFHVEHFNSWLYATLKLAEYAFIFIYVRSNPQTHRPIIGILLVHGVFQSILAVAQFHVEQIREFSTIGYHLPRMTDSGAATLDIAGTKVLRAYGTFPHPNVLGGFLAVCLVFLLNVSRETKLKAILCAITAGILAWGLLVSFSRSAWLTATIILLYFLAKNLAKKRFKTAFLVTLLGVISTLILIGFYSDLVIPRSLETVDNDPAIEYRADFNDMALTLFKERPIFGVGLGQYIRTAEHAFHVEPWQYQPPHNIFLLIAATTGLLGLITLLYVGTRIRFTWNTQKIAIILALLVIGSLDHYLLTIQQGQILLLTAISLIFSDY